MTHATKMLTAGFLGLASLFGTSQAMAQGRHHNDRDRDVKVGVELRTGNGTIVFSNGGVDFHRPQPKTREVIERVWVPAHYEERHVQVLVRKGHYIEKHTNVLVRAGHYVEQHTQVLAQRGYWTQQYTQPVFKTVVDRHGCKVTVMVKAGGYERVWVPDRYETRCVKVWVPDQYEQRCEKVWVPDRYETRCEKVYVAGTWTETRRVVYDDGHNHGRPGIDIRVATRGR